MAPAAPKNRTTPAGGGASKPKRARSSPVAVAGGEAASGSAAAGFPKEKVPAPTEPASRARPASSAVVIGDVTVEDAEALDCGVCFLPLKPPIFQCEVGHVLCSPCLDKLKTTGKCHLCGVATGNYRRCYAMERLVESIRVPCPHAAHGCTARPAYFDQHSHRQTCAHAPFRCPGAWCSFVGSMAALVDHFSGVHSWPCTTEVRAEEAFFLRLHDGFNFVRVNCAPDGHDATASSQYLFLLSVERQPLGRVVSVVCIRSPAADTVDDQGPSLREMQCELRYFVFYDPIDHKLCSHYQATRFKVSCTDLSNGLPTPDNSFQLVIPDSILGGNDQVTIKVGACIVIK